MNHFKSFAKKEHNLSLLAGHHRNSKVSIAANRLVPKVKRKIRRESEKLKLEAGAQSFWPQLNLMSQVFVK